MSEIKKSKIATFTKAYADGTIKEVTRVQRYYSEPTFTCPECKKDIKNVARRFHFDNCKEKFGSDNWLKINGWKQYHRYKRRMINRFEDPKSHELYQQWLRLHNQDDLFEYETMARNGGKGSLFIKDVDENREVYGGGSAIHWSKSKHKEGNKGPYSGKKFEYNPNHTCKVDNSGLITWDSFIDAVSKGMRLEPMNVDRSELVKLKKQQYEDILQRDKDIKEQHIKNIIGEY